jgi:chorismate mutase
VDDSTELHQLREQIDDIDDQILAIVAERMRLAVRIGELKRKRGIPIYDPDRERHIYQRLCSKAPKPVSPDMVRRIFERVIDESRRAEQRASND